ncbi:hypothetical protein [Burkholderia cenocepacia]|uniref:hypothetical protein n=1 Tax=Burkholderia cenocepacia TaxID=95486 RepID=UPI001CF5E376|nr:hypothetical protein [Burkholderia cenocepacia]
MTTSKLTEAQIAYALKQTERIVQGVRSSIKNLSAFLWARRLNSTLSTRLHKSLAEQDSKLVHC